MIGVEPGSEWGELEDAGGDKGGLAPCSKPKGEHEHAKGNLGLGCSLDQHFHHIGIVHCLQAACHKVAHIGVQVHTQRII
jgi:hypothetical protein